MRDELKKCKRIVAKAGTSILTSADDRISEKNLARLGMDILGVLKTKREVALVSSGAIAFGMQALGAKQRPKEMPVLQATAAIGQGKLMHAYEDFFSKQGMHAGQILLTRDGLESRERFLAARKTFEELFKLGAIPIVNENDTVATEEIKFSDNDILSVHVAHLIQADLLILLSDVDGFYLRDGSRIREVASAKEIDTELVKHLKDTRKEKTVGGMAAKLKAAKVAMDLGVSLMIVNGHQEGILQRALRGEDVGTIFWAGSEKKDARRKWIAFSAPRKGSVIVDTGAFEALRSKKRSLLSSGAVKARGNFDRGDIVELETLEGKVFGRGVVHYSSKELAKIAGKKTSEIESILGYKHQDELIHRNDMVLWS